MEDTSAIHFPSGENCPLDCKLGDSLVCPKARLGSFPSKSTTQICDAPFTNRSQSKYLPSGDQSVGELISEVSSSILGAPDPLDAFTFSVNRFPGWPKLYAKRVSSGDHT